MWVAFQSCQGQQVKQSLCDHRAHCSAPALHQFGFVALVSPVDVFSGAYLDCVGPIAFFIPSNNPLIFQSEADWISVQRLIQYLLAQFLHSSVCFQGVWKRVVLVVQQSNPLSFNQRLEDRYVCIEPILNFGILLTECLHCCSMCHILDMLPVVLCYYKDDNATSFGYVSGLRNNSLRAIKMFSLFRQAL